MSNYRNWIHSDFRFSLICSLLLSNCGAIRKRRSKDFHGPFVFRTFRGNFFLREKKLCKWKKFLVLSSCLIVDLNLYSFMQEVEDERPKVNFLVSTTFTGCQGSEKAVKCSQRTIKNWLEGAREYQTQICSEESPIQFELCAAVALLFLDERWVSTFNLDSECMVISFWEKGLFARIQMW